VTKSISVGEGKGVTVASIGTVREAKKEKLGYGGGREGGQLHALKTTHCALTEKCGCKGKKEEGKQTAKNKQFSGSDHNKNCVSVRDVGEKPGHGEQGGKRMCVRTIIKTCLGGCEPGGGGTTGKKQDCQKEDTHKCWGFLYAKKPDNGGVGREREKW